MFPSFNLLRALSVDLVDTQESRLKINLRGGGVGINLYLFIYLFSSMNTSQVWKMENFYYVLFVY